MAAQEPAENGRGDAGAGADITALAAEARGVAEQSEVRAENVPGHARAGVAFGAEAGGAAASFEQVTEVPGVAGKRIERGGGGEPGGEVLGDDEEAVALDEVGLQRRRAAGGMGVVVLDHGAGRVEAFPAGPAAAEPEGNRTSSATGKSSGGRPWPRCLLEPSKATSMPAESRRCSP